MSAAIEKLRFLDRGAQKGPWAAFSTTKTRCAFGTNHGSMSFFYMTLPGEVWSEIDTNNVYLIKHLRNLAPELLALWEACNTWVDGPDAMTPEGIKSADKALSQVIDALNAKAAEVLA
jgi:hypothetical protein